MNREKLLEHLKVLAEVSRKNNPSVTGILYCMMGAIRTCKEDELLTFLKPFSQKQIEEIKNIQAQQN